MVSTLPSRSPWPLAAVLAVMLFLALVIAGREVYFQTTLLETGDVAVNALQIDDAKHGTEIYGNYSRFQFNHPGPAFWYVYAAGEYVLHDWLGIVPSPHNAHLVASLAFQVACLALALAILNLWVGSGSFLALALLAGMWHFSVPAGAFNSIWPPHVLLMPFLCFLVATCSVAAGRLREVPVMVIMGGFLFHGHVAQPLFVGGLGLAAFWFYRRGEMKAGLWPGWKEWRNAHRRLLLLCGAWIGLFLVPLLIDVASYGTESNVATIIRRFLLNTQEGKSVLQSILYFLSFPSYAVNQEEVFTQLTAGSFTFFLDHAFILLCWAVALLGPAWLGWRWRAKIPEPMRHFLGTSYLLWALTAVLCVAWGLVQSGPMFQFNGVFYYGIYYYLGLLGLAILAWFFTRNWPIEATTVIFCLAVVITSWRYYMQAWRPEDTSLSIRDGVAAALQKTKADRPKHVVFEHDNWPDAAAVLLELQRRDVPFYTFPFWNFMFGRKHDYHHLSETPEAEADVWWVAAPAPDGLPITKNISLFTEPAVLDPRGAELSFAGQANGFRHLVGGMSTGNVDLAWTEEKRVALIFKALPAESDVQLVFDAESNVQPDAPLEQPAEVFFNGTSLGTVLAGPLRNQFVMTIPRAIWNQRPRALLELRFPKATEFRYFTRPGRAIWNAWGIWNIWFATAGNHTPVPVKSTRLALEPTEKKPVTPRPFTTELSPMDGRIDFTAEGDLGTYRVVGLGQPGKTMTRIEGNSATVLFFPPPTDSPVYLEVVAEPFSDAGEPPPQRCQVYFNGRLIFDSPFMGPGVIRAIIPRDEWARLPLALLQLRLPDASPHTLDGKPREGLALRWMTVSPHREPRP